MSTMSHIKNAISFIPKVIQEKDRKSIPKILAEALLLAIRNKTVPTYYFSRHLYKKKVTNIYDFIPDKVLYSISHYTNDDQVAPLLHNKLFFYFFYKNYFPNIAKVLMFNHKNLFSKDSVTFTLDGAEKLESVLYDLVNNTSATKSVFIKKAYYSYGGANTYRIDLKSFPFDKAFMQELFENVTKTGYLFQETIKQHEVMNKLNPSCINTIRMDTFIDKAGKVELVGPLVRMSISNSHVDNLSSGGCCVGVDPSTGRLKKYGYSFITKTGGNIFTAHPVTGQKFEGYEIPYFKEAKDFVLKVASLVPDLRLVGWDIAISESGPVLIEGNNNYNIPTNDLTYGGYRKNPVFRKVLEEFQIHGTS